MSQKMAAHRDVKFWEWGRMWVVPGVSPGRCGRDYLSQG